MINKIAIDIDNTILKNKSKIFNIIIKIDEWKINSLFKHAQKSTNLSTAEQIKTHIVSKNYKSKGILKNFIPLIRPKNFVAVKDCANTIKELKALGYEITILTSRPDNQIIINSTIQSLNNNKIYYDKVIFNCKNKAQFCKDNNYSAIIDDLPIHCKMTSQYGVNAICFNTKDNKQPHNYFSIKSWTDVKDILTLHNAKNVIEMNKIDIPKYVSDDFINNNRMTINRINNINLDDFKINSKDLSK